MFTDFTILASLSQIRQSEISLTELTILTNLRHILDISPKKVHFEIFLPLGGVIPDRNWELTHFILYFRCLNKYFAQFPSLIAAGQIEVS